MSPSPQTASPRIRWRQSRRRPSASALQPPRHLTCRASPMHKAALEDDSRRSVLVAARKGFHHEFARTLEPARQLRLHVDSQSRALVPAGDATQVCRPAAFAPVDRRGKVESGSTAHMGRRFGVRVVGARGVGRCSANARGARLAAEEQRCRRPPRPSVKYSLDLAEHSPAAPHDVVDQCFTFARASAPGAPSASPPRRWSRH